MGVNELVFELYTPKAKIKAVFNRLYSCSCYGNLFSNKNDHSLLIMLSHLFDTIVIISTEKEW